MARKKVGETDTVKVRYQGRLNDGTIVDQSTEERPLHFMLGKNETIKGFEEAILGMRVGDKKTVTIPYPKAYGALHKELIVKVPRNELPEGLELKVGRLLEITTQDDQLLKMRITAIDATNVTLDANHPLAGKDLTFDIELLEICKNEIPPLFLGAMENRQS